MRKLMYGYTDPLYILPFDHRSSFAKGLFDTAVPDAVTHEKITAYKRLVYEALLEANKTLQLPPSHFGVLVDEEYGQDILNQAKADGFVTLETTEKSGVEEFKFEYGQNFCDHLTDSQPDFAKALVRYNPEDHTEHNEHSLKNLHVLFDFVRTHNIKLLIEALVPATPEQLASVGNDQERYDRELRPALTVRLIHDFQKAGIECDVWKIEGFEERSQYEMISEAARNTEERKDVGLVILGRHETTEHVERWFEAGKGVPGVIGFAVGRTIFWDPLTKYRDGQLSADEARTAIAQGFIHFCRFFQN